MSKAAAAEDEPGLSVHLTWFVRRRIWFRRRCAVQDWNFEVPGLVLSISPGMNPFFIRSSAARYQSLTEKMRVTFMSSIFLHFSFYAFLIGGVL